MIEYLSGIEYGDNIPMEGWIEISADYDDWCELEHHWFFQVLMEYLQRKGTLKKYYRVSIQPGNTEEIKGMNEKEKERYKKINREIIHFVFTVLISALTAIIIVSLAIK